MNSIYTSLLALAAASPALLADINAAPPATPAPQTPTRVQGNCDLLASNTVRATFQGLRDLQVQGINDAAPATVQVAVFEVIDNLAYRRFVRYGDGELTPGTRFTVAVSRDIPGQPAAIADTIAAMQPGEEAVMKIDHLYVFGGQEGKALRPCSRMVRRADAAAAAPAQPQPIQPIVNQSSAFSRQVSVSVNGNGQTESVEVVTQKDGMTGAVTQRMFINGVEVDPTTRQPLAAATPQPQPAPAPAPAPAQPEQTDDSGDDTTVEHAPQNAAPIPAPAPAAPGAATTVAPQPAPAESDSF